MVHYFDYHGNNPRWPISHSFIHNLLSLVLAIIVRILLKVHGLNCIQLCLVDTQYVEQHRIGVTGLCTMELGGKNCITQLPNKVHGSAFYIPCAK